MRLRFGFCLLTLVGGGVFASATVLYDGSLGTTPISQGWGFGTIGTPTTSGPTGGAITFDSTANQSFLGGWARVSPVNLDRTLGYTVSFRLQVQTEVHNPDNQRAGVSFIVVGSDLKAVEIGFWQDRAFVYGDDVAFTPGEFGLLDTSLMRDYSLQVSGSSYTLSADGNLLVSGALRDYSFFGAPYSTANQLFVGDNTTRAASRFNWARYEVSAVPEPMTLGLLAAGALVALRRRSRRQ